MSRVITKNNKYVSSNQNTPTGKLDTLYSSGSKILSPIISTTLLGSENVTNKFEKESDDDTDIESDVDSETTDIESDSDNEDIKEEIIDKPIERNGNYDDKEIIKAVFVEGFSLSKAFTALEEGLGKDELVKIIFDEDCISISQEGINANVTINLVIYTDKLLEYNFNERPGYNTQICVNIKELKNKIVAKKNEGLTLRIVNNEKYPFLVYHGDIKDNHIKISNKTKKETELVDYTEKCYILKMKSDTITNIFKSGGGKNDDHIIIKCYTHGVIMTGYMNNGDLSFTDKTFGIIDNYIGEVKVGKKTIKMIEKENSMKPSHSITELLIEPGKPLGIRTPVGLIGYMSANISMI